MRLGGPHTPDNAIKLKSLHTHIVRRESLRDGKLYKLQAQAQTLEHKRHLSSHTADITLRECVRSWLFV